MRRRALPLPAIVWPRAAEVIRREAGPLLEQKALLWERSSDEGLTSLAHELRAALDSMAEAETQWKRRAFGSGAGTAEPTGTVEASGSESQHLGGPEFLLAREVADRLQVSVEYIRRVCREQDGTGLVGHQRRDGTWLIEERSVTRFEERRRSGR